MTRPTPTNWLVFQSDNHARAMAGCYGHPVVHTPNIDRIAARGALFENAYCASPLCCPSRAAIATGRFPHQTGYWDNAIAYDGRVPSWMHRLRAQGHTVVSIGKLHFRSCEDDNGFSDEIAPMHIVGGVGGLVGLLRWSDEEPVRSGQWELYLEQSTVGDSEYLAYDRRITELAVQWLRRHAYQGDKPWLLYVSYASPHPPFAVPQRLLDLYPENNMPLPAAFRPSERPTHPAIAWVRTKQGFREMTDAGVLQRIAAAYAALITHMDEQVGAVLAETEALGLLDRTRVLYTSDHGEAAGQHGLFGKYTLYEESVGVPLLVMGPDIPPGRRVRQTASLVDLFPTLVEGIGGHFAGEDAGLAGISLFPAIADDKASRTGFAEYHALASRSGAFMVRDGDWKLIYHVGWPAQLFDLASDPTELRDLGQDQAFAAKRAELERMLRSICNPEAVDRRAKEDQCRQAERHGGTEAILRRGAFTHTPVPAEFRPVDKR